MATRAPRTLVAAVRAAVRAADTQPEDIATVSLALMYAAAIDATPMLMERLGPKLLAALTALGCTPAGRRIQLQLAEPAPDPAPGTPGGEPVVVNPLAALRAERALRETRGT